MTEPLRLLMVGRRPEYVPMVTNNWIRSGEQCGLGYRVDSRVWTTYEHALIERYWREPHMQWLFAANPADTNFVHGWLCGEHTDLGPVLHYLYVRRSMRDKGLIKLGVAEALLRTFLGQYQALPVPRLTHTRTTSAWERLCHSGRTEALFEESFYNPFLAFQEFRPNVGG